MWEVTCPKCGHQGDSEEFDISLCDECCCPKCGTSFEIDTSGDDEEDDTD